MHELSVVADVIESVLGEAGARSMKRVTQVRLCVGELTQLEQEQLRFGYAAMIEKTVMEGSTLEIETVPAEVNCAHCSYEGPPKYWDGALSGVQIPTLQCPVCGHAAQAIRGHECSIKSIQYVA